MYTVSMLEIKHLVKQFGGLTASNSAQTKAVDDVSFSIDSGEVFSLIGPNGSGKTTIVKTIVGLLQPTAGEILLGGASITNDPVKAKSIIGYIPDEPTVWPGITGEEFLHFVGTLYGMSKKERRDAIPDLLAIFQLNGIERGYFEDYSRGNKQKFAILAALLHKPKVLLIDEPIVGLDPTSAEIAKKEFAKFAGNGGAVLLVTHTLTVAHEISHRIGVLKDGKMVIAGSFEELVAKAQLDAKKATLDDVYTALT